MNSIKGEKSKGEKGEIFTLKAIYWSVLFVNCRGHELCFFNSTSHTTHNTNKTSSDKIKTTPSKNTYKPTNQPNKAITRIDPNNNIIHKKLKTRIKTPKTKSPLPIHRSPATKSSKNWGNPKSPKSEIDNNSMPITKWQREEMNWEGLTRELEFRRMDAEKISAAHPWIRSFTWRRDSISVNWKPRSNKENRHLRKIRISISWSSS